MSEAYVGIDAHARTCTLGWMNEAGEYQREWTFATSQARLLRHIARIEAEPKIVTVEECPLAGWVARTLNPHVSKVFVCDPRENELISTHVNKGDSQDTYALCHLLRLGALKEVYHSSDDDRTVFKAAVRHYLDLRSQVVALKNKIVAKYQSWGIFKDWGFSWYAPDGREHYLEELPRRDLRELVENLYRVLDTTQQAKDRAHERMCHLGQRYPEIREFKKIPGMGPVGAHIFDAFIQTPYRFGSKSKLWRYCKLGIRQPSSAGRSIGGEGLDKRGVGELKHLSHHAWHVAVRKSGPNEVKTFYQASLERTGTENSARLNTQRKILATMWGLWKNESAYDPARFLGSVPSDR